MGSKSLNKVLLIGNLGKDPEIRYLPNGTQVANFSLATSEFRKDKDGQKGEEKTEWHRIVVFGKLAEIAGEYLAKGRKVFIEGRIQTRDWQDNSGQKRYTTEIVAQNLILLSPKGAGGAEAGGDEVTYEPVDNSKGGGGGGGSEEDIPF